MDQDENNTLADAGTENVETSTPENLSEFDYYDPDEDNVETETPDETEEGNGDGSDADAVSDDDGTADAKTDRYVLNDGTEVTLDELKTGHLRQADYTRKTQELGQSRQALEANSNRIANITQAFIDHLSSLVPAEPQAALAMTDPAKYTAMKAQYDATMATVNRLVQLGSQAKDVGQSITTEQRQSTVRAENAKLMEAVPQTRTDAGRQKFFKDVMATAATLGFTEQEIGTITDHRVFVALNMAARGAAAVKAGAVAKAKVQGVPPVTPKPKPGQAAAPVKNKIAMQKLTRSGSLRDAAKVDWV